MGGNLMMSGWFTDWFKVIDIVPIKEWEENIIHQASSEMVIVYLQ